MKHFCIIIFLSFFVSQLFAQDTTKHVQQPSASKIRRYRSGASEFIFSMGQVNNPAGQQFNPGLRFSMFFNQQEQFHFDFGKAFGIFTGFGIRNVGMINYPAHEVEVKQRVYGLGVPFALKFGNMRRRNYFAIGAEAEYFFNYKIKYFINHKKTKHNTWFPDEVNAFNPSVFAEIKMPKGFFIRAKYYLLDFLKASNSLTLPDGSAIPGYSSSSKLFYLSIGFNIKSPNKAKVKKDGSFDIEIDKNK